MPCQRMYPLLAAGALTGHGQLSVQDGSDEWIASASWDEREVEIRGPWVCNSKHSFSIHLERGNADGATATMYLHIRAYAQNRHSMKTRQFLFFRRFFEVNWVALVDYRSFLFCV